MLTQHLSVSLLSLFSWFFTPSFVRKSPPFQPPSAAPLSLSPLFSQSNDLLARIGTTWRCCLAGSSQRVYVCVCRGGWDGGGGGGGGVRVMVGGQSIFLYTRRRMSSKLRSNFPASWKWELRCLIGYFLFGMKTCKVNIYEEEVVQWTTQIIV